METEFISFKKILIFGSKGVGKTTLIKKMKMKKYINLEEQIVEEGKNYFYNLLYLFFRYKLSQVID